MRGGGRDGELAGLTGRDVAHDVVGGLDRAAGLRADDGYELRCGERAAGGDDESTAHQVTKQLAALSRNRARSPNRGSSLFAPLLECGSKSRYEQGPRAAWCSIPSNAKFAANAKRLMNLRLRERLRPVFERLARLAIGRRLARGAAGSLPQSAGNLRALSCARGST
jgi:hypothetical protein